MLTISDFLHLTMLFVDLKGGNYIWYSIICNMYYNILGIIQLINQDLNPKEYYLISLYLKIILRKHRGNNAYCIKSTLLHII